jgi:hypothetical protein
MAFRQDTKRDIVVYLCWIMLHVPSCGYIYSKKNMTITTIISFCGLSLSFIACCIALYAVIKTGQKASATIEKSIGQMERDIDWIKKELDKRNKTI